MRNILSYIMYFEYGELDLCDIFLCTRCPLLYRINFHNQLWDEGGGPFVTIGYCRFLICGYFSVYNDNRYMYVTCEKKKGIFLSYRNKNLMIYKCVS